jgi:hypothetical protein
MALTGASASSAIKIRTRPTRPDQVSLTELGPSRTTEAETSGRPLASGGVEDCRAQADNAKPERTKVRRSMMRTLSEFQATRAEDFASRLPLDEAPANRISGGGRSSRQTRI